MIWPKCMYTIFFTRFLTNENRVERIGTVIVSSNLLRSCCWYSFSDAV